MAEITPEIRSHLRDALYHLTSCWDALGRIEVAYATSIETDAIQAMAGDLGDPDDAYTLDDETVDEYLAALMQDEAVADA